ncbi:MAG: ATP-binding cassette domain-containing protein [Planctomycetota bacterium]
MLEVRDLYKNYGSFRAVRGISFSVDAGEVLGFLGPNGAGKTTTMKIVVGYMGMSSGVVKVDGLSVAERSREVRERIGYLPEHAPLYDDMTVIEYLRFMARMRGLSGPRRRERVEHVIGVCSLEAKRRALVSTLSKGYRQRVGLAQAIVHDPKLVILDEPTVGLDPNQIVEIREVLREIGRRNTVILSSHILSEVEATCRRVVIIASGSIVAEGTPEELEARHRDRRVHHLAIDGDAGDLEAALAAMPGLADVSRQPDGRFRFQAPADGSFAPALAGILAARGASIRELSSDRPTLEDVFRDLTAPVPVAAGGEA